MNKFIESVECGKELVSIIMPAYNASAYISESINSVLEQSFSDWVLYVIDDASVDSTFNIVNAYHDSRIRYHKLDSNSGVSIARNYGIKLAKGKYIAFLDSDDLWVKDKLKLQLTILDSGYDVVCSSYETFVENIDAKKSIRSFPIKFDYKTMLSGNKIGNLTGIYNQEKLGKVFQVKAGHEDYIMWLELVKRAKSAYCIQDVLAYYRLSSTSLSVNKFKASQWQWNVYREYQKMGFFISVYYWVRYVINAAFR